MRALSIIAVPGLVAGVALPAGAETMTFKVDCSSGDSIGAALARGDARKPLVLDISGTCRKAVSMSGGSIHDYGRHGVEIENGAEASFTGTVIQDNADAGISVLQARAFMNSQNAISGNHGAGVACNSHCTLPIGGGACIHDNNDAGIVLMRGSADWRISSDQRAKTVRRSAIRRRLATL